ncbi:MAG: hypothetical protein M9921_13140 [Fimbriimonadaceae bacterium]|nr:hypothetical protein [Fimbriimonadaceae bacterium]
MNVPPFVPEPIEIPGNVAEERYPVMLGFVRRVATMHVGSVLLVYGVAIAPLASPGLGVAALMLLAALATLSLVRTFTKPSALDQKISLVLFPLVLLALGWVVKEALAVGFPAWSPLFGLAAAWLFAMLCGRDLSFVGQFVISALVSSVALAVVATLRHVPSLVSTEALALNFGMLFYWVYDLASLLSRRRLGEEAAAVVDLYRDILNFITYPIRTVRHWRDYRIWRV